MAKSKLPAEVISFFERTTRKFSKLYKPAWLVCELEDPVWIVNSGVTVRDVEGTVKGGVRLRWDRLLPNGRFTNPVYAVPLEQARMIIVWAHDGAIKAGAKSLRTILHFHLYLMWLVEFLAVRYEERFHKDGFSIFGVDDIAEFLGAAEAGGVSGTGAFVQRWENYLSKVTVGNGAELVSDRLEELGALDIHGKLNMRFVAAMLGVDYKRIKQSPEFRHYLFQRMEYGKDFDAYDEGRLKLTLGLSGWMVTFCQVLSLLPIKVQDEIGDPYLVSDVVRPFRGRSDGRTKTLPLSIGRSLMLGCCKWMIDVYPAFNEYLREVISISRSLLDEADIGLFAALTLSERFAPISSELIPSFDVYKRMQTDSTIADAKVRTKFPFPIFLFRLHTAVCFCLTAILTSCRRSEVVELDCMASYEVGGRFYLSVSLRKTGGGNIREQMEKPIPRLVHECLETLNEFKALWRSIAPSSDLLFEHQAFFKINCRGAFPFTASDAYVVIKELSEFLGLADSAGVRWVVLPHQLRRYFAMTFFHFGGSENSLPALSWFMGHDDLEVTWRYIKESLTGKELTSSEAALATSAVCSDDQSEGIEQLRRIILDHFGCEKINVMHEDELRDYLELLAERGVYTATPIQINTGKGKRFTVAISIKEGTNATT
ncbi:hypothetical protein J2Y88_004282 [Pseudomonas chlororaphis]|uniref:hypothetical protein n=1 Tax=Pseudomonas chlororaphis TaxID=587753 RepID=UPI0020A0D4D8|nr:hypothetical protein [Pseudomonas chlororaphis]MCP1481971.1 hypothetical protein [Pseudomonas chlororaphis]MCP1597670.1 hypothetical protein [Pseudomonas chlororaphis]